MLTIIDADSLLYYSSKDTIQESIVELDNRISSILLRTKADNFIICLSSSSYFRKDIDPLYKDKRKPSTLKFIRTLKNYLVENYKGLIIQYLEADDIVSWLLNHPPLKEVDKVISAVDKDVIKQNQGTFYNYGKDEFVETSAREAVDFMFTQLITGDSTDNIKGIPGKGEVFAKSKIVPGNVKGNLLTVFSEYINHYGNIPKGIEEFYKNFKTVYLLKKDDEIAEYLDLEVFDINEFINETKNFNLEW